MDEGRVAYEDQWLLAWDKPAGIIVHDDGTGARTLTDVVREHLEATGREGVRPQPVQRLDAPTTGLVLFSLDKSCQASLDAQVAGHQMDKTYLAVVSGRGKASRTRVRLLACESGRSLLEVRLLTGRRHQIRVHLSSLGFPIVGDELYGGARCREGLLLHALSEAVTHPVTGERVVLRTAWPTRVWPREVPR